MSFVNTQETGLNGQAAVEVAPRTVETEHGAIRAFLTETGSIVVENAVGQAELHSEGYGFVMACEYGYTRNSGCAVGPSHRTYAPEIPQRSNGERHASNGIMRTMDGIARDFLKDNELAVVGRAHDHMVKVLAGWRAVKRPSGPRPEHHAVLDTPYGGVMAILSDKGMVKVTGLGFQGSIETDGLTYILDGNLDHRQKDQRNLTIERIFSEREGRTYHWRDVFPQLAGLGRQVFDDPEFMDAIKAREAYDQEMSAAIRSEEDFTRIAQEVQRVALAFDTLDPVTGPVPA